MKKVIVFLLLAGLLLACARRVKEWQLYDNTTIRWSDRKTENVTTESRIEKDTLVWVASPVEQSRNEGTDSSYLQTSLAWSVAVWSRGKLSHRIGNFPQMPSRQRVIYRDRWHSRTDTLTLRDTLQVREHQIFETGTRGSAWDRWWGMSGKIMLLIIAGYIVWRKLISK